MGVYFVSELKEQVYDGSLGNFFFFNINLFIYLFIFWLRWVFIAACGLSLVGASGCYSSLWWVGFSLWWLLFVVEHGLQACGLQ